MRKVTKNIVGVLSLGVLATSWSLGQAAESGLVITNTAAPTGSATPTPSASTDSTATPTPTPTKSATSAAASVTKKSDAVSYVAERRTGTMQISVTKVGSEITDVTIISGGTEGGEWSGVPARLAAMAVAAQGSGFGNITKATHTTDAFKTALENALAKF